MGSHLEAPDLASPRWRRLSPYNRGARLAVLLVTAAVVACGDDGDSSPTAPPPEPPETLPVEPPQAFIDCVDGTSAAGALFEVCLPELWNGEVIGWAHGYTNPGPDRPPHTPLRLPSDELGGAQIRDIARSLGNGVSGYFGYASTSYRTNGLVARDGAEDLEDLALFVRQAVTGLAGSTDLPVRSYLVGASEGSLSTVLALEGDGASVYDGGIALCGPIGSFADQINHMGDFRALFDHWFEGLMPGTAGEIPDEETTITDANWTALQPQIGTALAEDPGIAAQLFAVSGVPTDGTGSEAQTDVAIDLLRYSFFGTNDANSVLGGNPFDNRDRVYAGSADDAALNAQVDRFDRDPAATTGLAGHETTGGLGTPLVAMHTLQDPVVPYWHLALYEARAAEAGSDALLTTIPGQQFGHCQFTLPELLAGFSSLVLSVTNQNLVTTPGLIPDPAAQKAFLDLARAYRTDPVIVRR